LFQNSATSGAGRAAVKTQTLWCWNYSVWRRIKSPASSCLPARAGDLLHEGFAMDVPFKKKLEDVDMETIVNDFAVLKRDIGRILEHVKSATVDTAVDTAQDLASQIGDEAAGLYKDLSRRSQRTAKVINRKVEDNPGLSLLVAFGMGILVSRLMR
jgi:hypothetical protein